MRIQRTKLLGVVIASTAIAASTALADVAIRYDACGYRSLEWAPVDGADSYRVERRECDGCLGGWKLVAEVPSVSVADSDAPALEYRVRALAGSGAILGTQSAPGDQLRVQRLGLTPASETPPSIACGSVLRLEMGVTLPAEQDPVLYEWRCDGVPIGATAVPAFELIVDASLSGARFSVTATNQCGSSAFEWRPFTILGMPQGDALRWTSLLHQIDSSWGSGSCLNCYSCCGLAEPGTCDCSSCCSSNSGGSHEKHTPCNPAGIVQNGASLGVSASNRNFSEYHGGVSYWDHSNRSESWSASAVVQWPSTLRVQYSLQPGSYCVARASIVQDSGVVWSIDQSGPSFGTAMVPISEGIFTVVVEAGGCMGTGPVEDSASLGVQFSILAPNPDCNSNLRPDAIDISSGTSADIDSNGTPDECQTVTVPGQYQTIQAAIDSAPADTMRIVSVAAGEHVGPVNFLGKPIIVRGSGAAQTAIVGNGGQQASVVRFAGGEPAIAALERVTIRGGTTGTPFPGSPQYLCGGGIFGKDSAASVRDCVIEQNAAAFGGGAYLFNHAGRVDRCMVRGNTATEDGGGLQLYGGSTEVVDSAVEQNSAVHRGAGLHLVQGTPTILRTTIRGNQCTAGTAGGISWVPGGAASALLFLDDATVSGNSASNQGGIGVVTDDSGIVKLRLRGTSVCGNAPAPQVSGAYTDLGGNTICNCPADINADGVANGADLGRLLFDWGPCAGSACQSDLDGSGTVDGADLGALLAAWGPCAP